MIGIGSIMKDDYRWTYGITGKWIDKKTRQADPSCSYYGKFKSSISLYVAWNTTTRGCNLHVVLWVYWVSQALPDKYPCGGLDTSRHG